MRHRALALAVALLAMLAAGPGWGQSISLSAAAITMPNAGTAQLNAGYVEHGGMTITVNTLLFLTTWELYLKADQGTLGASKPLTDLQWRLEGSSTWRSVSAAPQRIAQGRGRETIRVYFRTHLGWSRDLPGIYATGLTFSVD